MSIEIEGGVPDESQKYNCRQTAEEGNDCGEKGEAGGGTEEMHVDLFDDVHAQSGDLKCRKG